MLRERREHIDARDRGETSKHGLAALGVCHDQRSNPKPKYVPD